MASTTSAGPSERQPLLAETRDVHYQNPDAGTSQASHAPSSSPDHPPRTLESAVQGTFTRSLGTAEAFAVVVSIVIGSGVFTSPGAIDTNVPSPGVALLVWLVGGLLAWTGASTMAELGTAIPGEGGVQPYLTHIFGDVFGFLAAWTWVVAVIPATLAIMVIVFVESAYAAAAGGTAADGPGGAPLSHKLWSIGVLAVLTAVNSISTRASTRLNAWFVVAKFTAITAVVLAGLGVVVLQLARPGQDVGGGDWARRPWFAARDSLNPDGSVTHWDDLGLWEVLGHLSAALYAALWAYSGWDKVRLLFLSSVVMKWDTKHCVPRPSTSRRNSPAQHASSRSPLTPPLPLCSFASSPPMPLTTSSCPGISYQQLTVSLL
jgi:L-type amino acid transporter 9